MAGSFRDLLLNYTVCKAKYEGRIGQKPGVSRKSVMYNLTQSLKMNDLIYA